MIGTKALKEPDWFRDVCQRFPNKLAVGIDARDGRVATDGWLQTSDTPATELARTLAEEPICAIIYTDIAKDGMLEGTEFGGDDGNEQRGRPTGHCFWRCNHGRRRAAIGKNKCSRLYHRTRAIRRNARPGRGNSWQPRKRLNDEK